MSLKDIQWTDLGSGGYRATAKYSGTATGSKPTGYISTGTYIGEVTKSTPKSVTYKVIYDGYTIPPLPPSSLPWILGVIAVIICIAVVILLFIYRKNVKIYGLLNGRYRVVKRRRISYVDPFIDLTAVGLHVTCEEYIIAIDRLAVSNLHGQFVRILCEDGSCINRKVMSRYALSEQMSVIPSKHVLFNETIKDNITLKKDFSLILFDVIINMLDINKTFDFSLDKNLGQTKDSLSDGQKQRVILARGLLENKKVIVMDEPENHLDSETKKAFGDYIEKNKRNKIIIISTHNQQLLDSCDYIIPIGDLDIQANLNAAVKQNN